MVRGSVLRLSAGSTWGSAQMKSNAAICFLTVFAAFGHECIGYEMNSHYRFSDKAFVVSDLALTETLEALGLSRISMGQKFLTTTGENEKHFADVRPLCSHPALETIPRLIACGAMFEDA